MEQYDFDRIVDRHNTDCLKYDFTAEYAIPSDVHSYWVADMDFPTAPEILEAINQRTAHGIFGYTDIRPHYYEAVAHWYGKRFGYTPSRESLVVMPGIVFAMSCAIRTCTRPGDAVLIQSPVYYPFRRSIRMLGRIVADSPLINTNGHYEIDFADFERTISEQHVKLFLLCSPHNPVGRVWKKDELEKMAAICLRYGVRVFADEIHSDFVFTGNQHIPFPSLSAASEHNTIWGTAPSKTFNLAGLQNANVFIADKKLKELFMKERDATGYSEPNTLGVTAAEAAYRFGEPWFDSLKTYIERNLEKASALLASREPRIRVQKPEGTYLLWLDFRKFELPEMVLNDRIIHSAKLWLDAGHIFGKTGVGFERINAACPWKYLEEGLNQLIAETMRW